MFFPLLLGSSISFFLVSCSGGSDVTQEERVRDAEIFLPDLAGGLGPGLGRKYAYLVLPTVLMPRGGKCPSIMILIVACTRIQGRATQECDLSSSRGVLKTYIFRGSISEVIFKTIDFSNAM